MADDTFTARGIGDIYIGGDPNKEWAACAEAIAPGETMRISSDGKIYNTKAGDAIVSGVMALKDGHNIDTDYSTTTDGLCPWYPKGQKTRVYVRVKAASPAVVMNVGYPAVLSDTDGLVVPFAYTDAAAGTDTLVNAVGTWKKYHAGHAADMIINELYLGL